jgi:uncharacterized protein (DUF488 family)
VAGPFRFEAVAMHDATQMHDDAPIAKIAAMPESVPDKARSPIATIGYERAKLDDFLRSLREADVTILFDIRANAWSRRSEFAAKRLEAALAAAGIAYRHLPALGSPDPARDAARAGDAAGFERHYRAQLETEAARDGLTIVADAAARGPVCLMCYERDPRDCHRRMTADALQAMTGHEPRHLFVAAEPAPGTLL